MPKTVDKDIFCKHRRINTNPKYIRNKKHGMTDTPLYYIWCSIKQRCNNKNNSKWDIYGGKGIKICPEWENNFNAFMEWALNNNYKTGLTIDRINGDKNYCPENCRWVTYKEQNRNLKSNVNITFNGITKCINEWADFLGINKNTLYRRFYKGWSVEKALTTPVNVFYRRNYKK